MYIYNIYSINIYYLYIILRQNIYTDFFLVIYNIPKILTNLLRILDTHDAKTLGKDLFSNIFKDTQQNHSSIRIGKSGITFPNRIRNTMLSPLALKVYMLTFFK